MSAEYSNGGGRRRNSSGGGRRGSYRNNDRGEKVERKPRVEKKKSILDKIIGFFSGGSKAPVRKKRVDSERTSVDFEKPAREPRESQGSKPPLEEPNPDSVTGTRLYVGNLSYDTVESDLFDLFSKVGKVNNVELVMDRRNNRSKGFAFLEMESMETAKKAVMEIHRMEFMGRNLVVSGAKNERREREESAGEPAA